MRRNIVIFILLFAKTCLIAQKDATRNSTHIFWSEKDQISMSDFHDTLNSEKNIEMCQKYNLCWGAYTGLFVVMDVPKKKKDKRTKEELVYFAPAFEVKNSYRTNSDSTEFLKQKLVFDMYEWAARKCRMELDSIYNSNPSIGIKGIFFKTVESEVQKKLGFMVRLYTEEVYIQQLEGAFEKWIIIVQELLEDTVEFKTTSIDRLRFIKKEPVVEGYVKAKNVIGNLFEER